MHKPLLVVSTFLALVAAGTGAPRTAAADTPTVQMNTMEQLCTGGSPSATITLAQINAGYQGSATSDANYMATGCKMFTADLKLSGNASSRWLLSAGASYVSTLSQAQCEKAQDQFLVYKKNNMSGSFVFVSGGVRRGKWSGSSCAMEPISSYVKGSSTSSNGFSILGWTDGETYRFVEVGIIGGSAERVKISVSAMQGPA
jgi:hypothetical protein